jgi:uncharacterized membrane protein
MTGNSITDLLSIFIIISIVFNFGVNQYRITRQIKVLKRVVLKIAKKLDIELFDIDIK